MKATAPPCHPLAITPALIAFIWAPSHHLLAGVRHLLMDIGVRSHLADARRSAWSVNVGGVVMALLAAGVGL